MSKLSDPSLVFHVPDEIVAQSLKFMHQQGLLRREAVALWLGRLNEDGCEIDEVLIPKQVAGELFYRIPNDETFRIVQEISQRNLVIPIQIHSHPRKAFHSAADDEYAFVQHENAISIVVPDFANFSPSEFLSKARFYRLRENNQWLEMESEEVAYSFRFITA